MHSTTDDTFVPFPYEHDWKTRKTRSQQQIRYNNKFKQFLISSSSRPSEWVIIKWRNNCYFNPQKKKKSLLKMLKFSSTSEQMISIRVINWKVIVRSQITSCFVSTHTQEKKKNWIRNRKISATKSFQPAEKTTNQFACHIQIHCPKLINISLLFIWMWQIVAEASTNQPIRGGFFLLLCLLTASKLNWNH